MKVVYEKVDYKWQEAFNIQKYSLSKFETPWHFHPEHELVLILKGHGKRFVADSIENFREGDLVLIKGNTPHFWMSDNSFYQNDPTLKCESIYIQFLDSVFPENYRETANFRNIVHALKLAERGISIIGKDQKNIVDQILQLYQSKGLSSITILYEILENIGKLIEYQFLGTKRYANSYLTYESKIISSVHQFLVRNFKRKILLDEIAAVANYSPAAFCRHFKSVTNKSVFEYLNDIRIDYACKLLINRELSITQIAYESGFNSISHFNRQFRKITDGSPREYRKQFEHGV